MCNRPRSATRFSFDFELQGMMICGAFTEIFKPIFAPCCWMYCTFGKKKRYQFLLITSLRQWKMLQSWLLYRLATTAWGHAWEEKKRKLNKIEQLLFLILLLLFVCLFYLCHNVNLVTVLKRVFLPKAARQESNFLGIVVWTTLGQLPPNGDLKKPNTTNILGIFFRHTVRTWFKTAFCVSSWA